MMENTPWEIKVFLINTDKRAESSYHLYSPTYKLCLGYFSSFDSLFFEIR